MCYMELPNFDTMATETWSKQVGTLVMGILRKMNIHAIPIIQGNKRKWKADEYLNLKFIMESKNMLHLTDLKILNYKIIEFSQSIYFKKMIPFFSVLSWSK